MFFHLVLCPWIYSSVCQFTVDANFNLYPTVVRKLYTSHLFWKKKILFSGRSVFGPPLPLLLVSTSLPLASPDTLSRGSCSFSTPLFTSLHLVVVVLLTQSCLTLCDPTDCSPPNSSVHGILQARVPERVAMPSSRGIFLTQGWNQCLLLCRQTWIQSPYTYQTLFAHYAYLRSSHQKTGSKMES